MRGPDYVILDVAYPLAQLNEAIALSLEEADIALILGGVQECEVLNYLDDIIQCLEYADQGHDNLRDYVEGLMNREADEEMSKFKIAERVYQLGIHILHQMYQFNMYAPEGLIRYFFFERFEDAIVLMHNDAVPGRAINVGVPPRVCSY
ncbi:MAG: hypothetical protein P4L77_11910 [Sulfuriferula sp.]|nr:hypothetical protein [Sulfuriferula sp.]